MNPFFWWMTPAQRAFFGVRTPAEIAASWLKRGRKW